MIHAIRSEWIKLRSARSNVVLLVLAVAVPIGLTVLVTSVVKTTDVVGSDKFMLLVASIFIGQILVGVTGVLVIGQEYRHNTIRVTFTAEPRRLRVMVAKVIAVALTGFVVGVVTTFGCYWIGKAILSVRDFGDLGVSTGTQMRVLWGTIILFVLSGLWGLGLGAVIRATAGAITFLVLWPLLPENIINGFFPKVGKWLPFQAGGQLMAVNRTEDALSPWTGGLVFAAWVLLVLALGTLLVVRRDA
jgi:ABC-2 type transport system permease protein